MDKFIIIVGAVGVFCILASLIALGMASASRGHWGVALTCLGSFTVIVFLLLTGYEYSQGWWEGR